jgi:hypothetical protein
MAICAQLKFTRPTVFTIGNFVRFVWEQLPDLAAQLAADFRNLLRSSLYVRINEPNMKKAVLPKFEVVFTPPRFRALEFKDLNDDAIPACQKYQPSATKVGSKDVLNNLSEWRVVSNQFCRTGNHVKAKNLTVP